MELVLSHKGRSGFVEAGVGGRCEHVCIRLQSVRLYVCECMYICVYVCGVFVYWLIQLWELVKQTLSVQGQAVRKGR